jgi:hypothetical protein
VVTTYGTGTPGDDWKRAAGIDADPEEGFTEYLKLGHDVRFLLVVVGGGAVRVGREVARQHLRYLETVAVNCDVRVQDNEEFDRRVYLRPDSGAEGDTHGSPIAGHQLAKAAEPSLERVFEGATFVTIIVSLGGGSGTGALPVVLEAAARSCAVVSVFAIRPFEAETERRAVADRSLAHLNFLPAWVEKKDRHLASLQLLDNEAMARESPRLPIRDLNRHWAEVIAQHIENVFLLPAEAAVDASRIPVRADSESVSSLPSMNELESPVIPRPPDDVPLPPFDPPPLAPGATLEEPPEAVLTFEVEFPGPGAGS